MNDERAQLELSIASADDAAIESILAGLGDVEVARARPARLPDPETILSVAGAAVALVNELLTLRERLRAMGSAPAIVVRNRHGDEALLSAATDEDLAALVDRPG